VSAAHEARRRTRESLQPRLEAAEARHLFVLLFALCFRSKIKSKMCMARSHHLFFSFFWRVRVRVRVRVCARARARAW
jgi:hypothetical protein